MVGNNELLEALNPEKIVKSDRKLRDNALNAIVLADVNDAVAFKKAITDHIGFWNTIDKQLNNEIVLKPESEPSFSTIKQSAILNRVRLGLLNQAPEEVLIKILKHNETECRQYLADRLAEQGFELSKAPGWDPTHENVLTKNGIGVIKSDAKYFLLIQSINKCTSVEDLIPLINLQEAIKKNDQKKAQEIVLKLGFPPNEIVNLEVMKQVSDTIKNKLTELNETKNKIDFNDFVSKLKPEQQQKLLESVLFQNDIEQAGFKNKLSENEENWARNVLLTQYLQTFLKNQAADNDVIKALNQPDENLFKSQLNGYFKNKNKNIDYKPKDLVNKENINLLRKSIVEGIIANSKNLNQLVKLQNTEDFTSFKSELKGLGITNVDWLTKEDMSDFGKPILLQVNKMRQDAFRTVIKKIDPFAPEKHEALFEAFKKLDPKKQIELLNEGKKHTTEEHSRKLQQLLTAKDEHVIKHLLGDKVTNSSAIVKENERLSLFKSIHNAEVARILAGLLDKITAEEVKEINSLFIERDNQDIIAGASPILFADVGEYSDLITQIGSIINKKSLIKDKVAFFEAFGLNNEEKAFLKSDTTHINIENQHDFNKELLPLYYSTITKESAKSYLDVVLRVNKSEVVKMDKKALDGTLKTLYSSKTVDEFLKGIKPPSIKSQLAKELTTTVFNEIKNQYRKEQFLLKNNTFITNEVSNLVHSLQDFKNKRILLTDNLNKLKDSNVTDISFALGIKNRDPELEKNCIRIIDQLRREEIALMGYLNSIPDTVKTNQLPELKKKLQAELLIVKKDLVFYEELQTRILNAENKTHELAVRSTNVHYEHVPKGKASTFVPTVTLDAVITLKPELKLGVKEKLKPGEEGHYTVTNDTGEGVGKFIERVTDTPTSYKSKGGETSKTPDTQFEFKEMVKTPPGNVQAAMELAKTVLLKWDGKSPIVLSGGSKEKLEMAWTALNELGQHHPGFSSSIIKVRSAAFDPSTQLKNWGYRYSDTSIHTTVFKSSLVKDLVKDEVEVFKKLVKEKSGYKQHETLMGKIIKEEKVSTKEEQFKEKLHNIQNKVDKTIEKEGPSSKYNPK